METGSNSIAKSVTSDESLTQEFVEARQSPKMRFKKGAKEYVIWDWNQGPTGVIVEIDLPDSDYIITVERDIGGGE